MYGGYPPYPPRYPYPPPVYVPRPTRSVIPRVVGIMSLVFSVIGIGMALLMTFGPMSDLDRWDVPLDSLGGYGAWMWIYVVLSLLIFGAHLAAGITSTLYKPFGPTLSTIYAASALAVAVIDLLLIFALLPGDTEGRVYDTVALPRIFIELVSLPWPIVVLILMNMRGARSACRPGAPG